MAGVGGGADSKSHNVELNLTSMIDLMSVLVSFLLMTAVWQQIAAIKSTVEARGKTTVTTAQPEDNRVSVHVSSSGYRITWPGKTRGRFPASIKGYNIEELSKNVASALTLQTGLVGAVSGDDRVDYGAIAQAIDAVRLGGIVSVGLQVN